jgi:hypothetical protein
VGGIAGRPGTFLCSLTAHARIHWIERQWAVLPQCAQSGNHLPAPSDRKNGKDLGQCAWLWLPELGSRVQPTPQAHARHHAHTSDIQNIYIM